MLHTPPLNIGYCGPTAIAAVTGRTRSAIYAAIHEARSFARTVCGTRYMPVFGMTNVELLEAMDVLGWRRTGSFTPTDRMTLDTFMTLYGRVDGPFIVNVTGHYIAVSHGEVCDTRTRMPLEYDRWRNRRGGRHVKHWWRFAQ